MNCREAKYLMGAYLYGDLPPSDMKLLRLHVEGCSSCKVDIESRGQAVSAVPGAVPELTDYDRSWIATSVRAKLRKQPERNVWYVPRFSAAFGVAAVVLAGIVIGSVLGQSGARMMAYTPPPERAIVEISRVERAANPKGTREPRPERSVTPDNPLEPSSASRANVILNMMRNAPVLGTSTNRGESPRDPVGPSMDDSQTPGVIFDEKPGAEVITNEENSDKQPVSTDQPPRE